MLRCWHRQTFLIEHNGMSKLKMAVSPVLRASAEFDVTFAIVFQIIKDNRTNADSFGLMCVLHQRVLDSSSNIASARLTAS